MLFGTLLATFIGWFFGKLKSKLIGTFSGKLSPELSDRLLGPFYSEIIGPLFALPLSTLRRTLDFAQLRPIL